MSFKLITLAAVFATAGLANAATATPAAAATDFFFHYSATELKNGGARHRLYRRLGREANEVCAAAAKSAGEHAACVADVTSRVVNGIGDVNLSGIHKRKSRRDG